MSLFSEMAAIKAAMRSRGLAKVSFHLKFSLINTLGRKTSTCYKVIVGCDTRFSELLRIYREARSLSEGLLPPSVTARRAYRNLFFKHFCRNMFSNMNNIACYGDLVFDRRNKPSDCVALVYDIMSPPDAIPRISKVIADPRLIPWDVAPFRFDSLCSSGRGIRPITDQT